MLEWVQSQGNGFNLKTLATAAEYGQLHVLEWFYTHTNKFETTYDESQERIWPLIVTSAAKHGHIAIIEWLSELIETDWEQECCTVAAKHGQLKLLKWFKEHDYVEYNSPVTLSAAVEAEQEKIITWLIRNDAEFDSEVCAVAAAKGNRTVLELGKQNWTDNTSRNAAKHGHFEVLKWLLEKGCATSDITSSAAEGGHLEILQWLVSSGHPLSDYCGTCAVKGGNLDMIRWLDSKGIECEISDCEIAVKQDHLEILKWLKNKLNCKQLNFSLMEKATPQSSNELIMWVSENCEWDSADYNVWSNLADRGYFETLSQILEKHPSYLAWGTIAESATSHGHINITKWALKNSVQIIDFLLETSAAEHTDSAYPLFAWISKQIAPTDQ